MSKINEDDILDREFDFTNARKNPYAKELKNITIEHIYYGLHQDGKNKPCSYQLFQGRGHSHRYSVPDPDKPVSDRLCKE